MRCVTFVGAVPPLYAQNYFTPYRLVAIAVGIQAEPQRSMQMYEQRDGGQHFTAVKRRALTGQYTAPSLAVYWRSHCDHLLRSTIVASTVHVHIRSCYRRHRSNVIEAPLASKAGHLRVAGRLTWFIAHVEAFWGEISRVTWLVSALRAGRFVRVSRSLVQRPASSTTAVNTQ